MKLPWSVVALLLGLSFVAAATIVGIASTPHGLDANSTPLITELISMAGSIVLTVLAVWKADKAHGAASKAASDTEALRNGEIPERLRQAVQELQAVPPNTTKGTSGSAETR